MGNGERLSALIGGVMVSVCIIGGGSPLHLMNAPAPPTGGGACISGLNCGCIRYVTCPGTRPHRPPPTVGPEPEPSQDTVPPESESTAP